MAVLAFLVFSIGDDLLAYGSTLVDRRCGSLSECWSQLAVTRNERQFEALLKRHYPPEATAADSISATEMSSESLDSCDFAYQEAFSPGSVSLDKSSSTEVVHTVENITEVSPGLCFAVSGTILLTCERFSVNLLLKNGDVALHFNPRLPQNYIVRNCRVKGCWGREEVASPLTFNLHRGQRFNVQVLVTEREFLICVNGRHFNAFKHRLPYKKITTLEVKGDVRDVAVDQCVRCRRGDCLLACCARYSSNTNKKKKKTRKLKSVICETEIETLRTIPKIRSHSNDERAAVRSFDIQ
uniref:Galectin n=1 Tax=Anopheles atroparvus TaxID=41427 RepID=A0AAG5D848_ANOAO